MIKKYSFRKIAITTLLLLLSFLLYNYPKEINTNINDMNKKEINVIRDVNGYLSLIKIDYKSDNIDDKISLIIEDMKNNGLLPKDTSINGFALDNGLLKIDFNKDFLNMKDEDKTIEALVYSLTDLKEINKIMIYIDGNRLSELPISKKKLDLYLDRSYGINKIYDIKSINDISMVMLYFYNKDNNLVPVSYFYNDNNDKLSIIFKELKSNTFIANDLTSYLNNEVELMNYELYEDRIVLEFSDKLLNMYIDGSLVEEVKYTIGYSICDTFNVNKVEFAINTKKIDELILAN